MAILITSTHKFTYGGTKSNIYGRLKSMVFDNTVGQERIVLNFEYFFNESARTAKAIPIQPDPKDSLSHVQRITIPKDQLLQMDVFNDTLTNALDQLGDRIYTLWAAKILVFNQDVDDGHWTYDAGKPEEFTPPKIVFTPQA